MSGESLGSPWFGTLCFGPGSGGRGWGGFGIAGSTLGTGLDIVRSISGGRMTPASVSAAAGTFGRGSPWGSLLDGESWALAPAARAPIIVRASQRADRGPGRPWVARYGFTAAMRSFLLTRKPPMCPPPSERLREEGLENRPCARIDPE